MYENKLSINLQNMARQTLTYLDLVLRKGCVN